MVQFEAMSQVPSPPPLPVELLPYQSVGDAGFRPVVRAVSLAAAAQALLLLVGFAAQLIMYYSATTRVTNVANQLGLGCEILVGAAAVAVITAALLACQLLRGGDWWLLGASLGMIVALLLRDAARMWGVIQQVSRMGSMPAGWMVSYVTSTVIGFGLTLIIPALVIWLMLRPEVRRLFT